MSAPPPPAKKAKKARAPAVLPDELGFLSKENYGRFMKFHEESPQQDDGTAGNANIVAHAVVLGPNEPDLVLSKLTILQLRLLCRKVGVTYVNAKNKYQCRMSLELQWREILLRQAAATDGSCNQEERTPRNTIRLGMRTTVAAIGKEAAETDVLEESINHKLNTVNQQLKELHNKLEDSDKKRALEFAFENASFGSFEYCKGNRYNEIMNSTDLVKTAILRFRRDQGYNLPDRAVMKDDYFRSDDPIRQKKFRDALVHQVYSLIGKKPRISLESDQKTYAIYYK